MKCGFSRFILGRRPRIPHSVISRWATRLTQRAAKDFSNIAASEVAFRWGDTFVASTLTDAQQAELARQLRSATYGQASQEMQLGNERYLATTVELSPDAQPRGFSDRFEIVRQSHSISDGI